MAATRPSPGREEVLRFWNEHPSLSAREVLDYFQLQVHENTLYRWRNRAPKAPPGGDIDEVPVPPEVERPRKERPGGHLETKLAARANCPLAEMANQDRARILGFKQKALERLNSEGAIEDPRGTRDLVSALVMLAGAVPDLMSMEQQLRGDDPNHGTLASPDAVERLRAIRQQPARGEE